ncbi:hypothetical protein GCM10007972_18800 [Iodidimonas muriae]|uniref:Glycosyltransferase n=1 Tax=Iodidimonas muriae TaxID=261467 RepID=A0ABQ2LDX4_9PROT|nr:TIGR04282 family arsenosugar biosynthesis glycosyltransferase [Iodidimonas muriae]GER07093.1 hypothetical protein JCM17843_14030 [Kordiimonadales bacterium JCM 17843]GGO13031.1 hypothetical protein GCM10007972_18800 [Iodidimonas muriae]
MTGAVAVFVKTPGLTAPKTRLAASIGPDAAGEFYHHSLDAVEETVSRFLKPRADWIARWAVAEEEGVSHPRWQSFGARHTGPGDLGARMWRIYEGLRRVHGRVFLIGADAPQLTAQHLKAAEKVLDSHDFVFGPASDGGFWLFGGRRVVPKEVWTVPRYSTAHARSDLEQAMIEAGLQKPAHLLPLTDVDEVADLAALAQEMPKSRTVSQRKIMGWVKRMEQA